MANADVYAKMAPIYDVVFGPLLQPGRVAAVARMTCRRAKVLEIGMGTGLTALLYPSQYEVTGIDISEQMLVKARERVLREGLPQIRVAQMDAGRLAFADDSFDVVVSSECIEHTTDPARAVCELVRVCRPGGLIALSCPNRLWKWSVVMANRFGLRPYNGIENWPGWHELRGWFRAAGTTILKSRGVHLFPFQMRPLRPLLRCCDTLGGLIGPLFINQALLARKRG